MKNFPNIQKLYTMEHFSLLCLFLLIREWLIPIDELTGFYILPILSYGLICLYLIGILFRKRVYATFVSFVGFIISLNALYFTTPLLQMDWMWKLFDLLRSDFLQVLILGHKLIQPVTYYFLVTLSLILLVPVLRYFLVTRGFGVVFVLLTGVFLAYLDSYGWYEAEGPFVRFICISFLLMASREIHRLEQLSTKVDLTWRKWLPLLVSLGVIGAMIVPAYFAPKYGPSWTDPYSYFLTKSASGPSETKPLPKQVGYSNRDDSLGGPMLDDDTLVFTGITNEKYYWRGNTREVYTGSGWLKRDQKLTPVLVPKEYNFPPLFFKGVEGKEVRATLQFNDNYRYPQIFYQGELKQITSYTPETLTLMYEPDGGHIQAHDGVYDVFRGDQVFKEPDYMYLRMSEYSTVSVIPVLDEAKLKAAKANYSDDIRNNYLQLPKTVPLRVKQLAQEITQSSTNNYDKVKAVVKYLHDNGKYKYERIDVPVVQPGHDFVDQFLFDDLRGYCDHFSTSMAVMLRSVGIPARWVKGFTSGKAAGRDANGNTIMEIRNKDTHSWVEVYFPEVGWVPFEPTPTFVSPVQIGSLTATSRVPIPEQTNDSQDRKTVEDRHEMENEVTGESGMPWGWIILSGGVLVWLGFRGWRRRTRIQRWMLQRELLLFSRHMPFRQQFVALLGILERDYVPRTKDETVREYINRLNISYDEKDEIRQVSGVYERAVYGMQQVEEEVRRKTHRVLTSLVKKIKR